jgi:hypothetical protein
MMVNTSRCNTGVDLRVPKKPIVDLGNGEKGVVLSRTVSLLVRIVLYPCPFLVFSTELAVVLLNPVHS